MNPGETDMRTLVCVLALNCLTAAALAETDPAFQANFRGDAAGSIEIGRIAFSDLVKPNWRAFPAICAMIWSDP
jgi:hypothetical protein